MTTSSPLGMNMSCMTVCVVLVLIVCSSCGTLIGFVVRPQYYFDYYIEIVVGDGWVVVV